MTRFDGVNVSGLLTKELNLKLARYEKQKIRFTRRAYTLPSAICFLFNLIKLLNGILSPLISETFI